MSTHITFLARTLRTKSTTIKACQSRILLYHLFSRDSHDKIHYHSSMSKPYPLIIIFLARTLRIKSTTIQACQSLGHLYHLLSRDSHDKIHYHSSMSKPYPLISSSQPGLSGPNPLPFWHVKAVSSHITFLVGTLRTKSTTIQVCQIFFTHITFLVGTLRTKFTTIQA